MEYKFEDITVENFIEWDQALIRNNINNPFQSGSLYSALKENVYFKPFGRIIRNNSNNEIVGGYIFYINQDVKSIFGSIFNRVIINGGPVIFNNNRNTLRYVLLDILNHPSLKGVYLEIWHDRKVVFPEVYKDAGLNFIPHLNYIIPLNKGIEQVWENIDKKRRKTIKRYTTKLNIHKIENLEDLKKSYQILEDSYKRIKLPLLDFSVFSDIFKSNNGLFFLAEKENKPIATHIRLLFNKGIYAWFAGDKRSEGNFHANECLQWETLKYGINNGFSSFNFGGAGKPGVKYGPRDYKASYGGELVNYGRHRYTLSKISSRLLKTLISVRKFLTN